MYSTSTFVSSISFRTLITID